VRGQRWSEHRFEARRPSRIVVWERRRERCVFVAEATPGTGQAFLLEHTIQKVIESRPNC